MKRKWLSCILFLCARKCIALISFKPHFNSKMNVILLPQASHLGICHISAKSCDMNSALLSPWPTAPSTFMRVMGNSVYDIETQEFISLFLTGRVQLPLFIFIFLFLEEIVHSAQDSKDTKRYRVKRKSPFLLGSQIPSSSS